MSQGHTTRRTSVRASLAGEPGFNPPEPDPCDQASSLARQLQPCLRELDTDTLQDLRNRIVDVLYAAEMERRYPRPAHGAHD